MIDHTLFPAMPAWLIVLLLLALGGLYVAREFEAAGEIIDHQIEEDEP